MSKGRVPAGWKRVVLNMCPPKTAYKSRTSATKAMKEAVAKHRGDGIPGRTGLGTIYRCPFCGWWHWGHDRKKHTIIPPEIVEKYREMVLLARESYDRGEPQ